MRARRRSVILLSGGLDSAANLAFCRALDEPVLALTANYGQRAYEPEARAARALCAHYGVRHEVVDLTWLGALGGSALTEPDSEIPSLEASMLDDASVTLATARAVWVPNRNGVLINVAAAHAERLGADRVVVGFNIEEAATFPDNSAEFLKRATDSLALSTANGVEVFGYTTRWDKRRIVGELRALSKASATAQAFPFDAVWSCYGAGPRACGRCESCQRLRRALGEPPSALPLHPSSA